MPGNLVIRPITLRAACAFVKEHHRHNPPPRGHKFSISVRAGNALIGVAIAGRPVSRALDDGLTIEVTRGCTTEGRERLENGHVDGAASMLYARIWRAAKAMGYDRGTTYTQGDEDGRSLHAAGWVKVADLEPRASWAESSVKLAHIRAPEGTGGVPRARWQIGRMT